MVAPRISSEEHIEELVKLALLGVRVTPDGRPAEVPPTVEAHYFRMNLQDEEWTLFLIRQAREHGFRGVSVDLIYGLPKQTADSFTHTLESVVQAKPDRIAAYSYAHLPEMFRAQRLIRNEDMPSAAEKLALLTRTVEFLTGRGYEYIGMDHFALPEDDLVKARNNGTLHRNFQGYSTHADCDLIGIGVTAIGKVCDNYTQNVRDLEEYYQRIDSGQFALERGVELEPDDLLRNEIITQLMCHFSLDIEALEGSWKFDFSAHFRPEIEDLALMQKDGLLQFDGKRLQILPAGRLLVRNICMVFDRYLRERDGSGGFSKVI